MYQTLFCLSEKYNILHFAQLSSMFQIYLHSLSFVYFAKDFNFQFLFKYEIEYRALASNITLYSLILFLPPIQSSPNREKQPLGIHKHWTVYS